MDSYQKNLGQSLEEATSTHLKLPMSVSDFTSANRKRNEAADQKTSGGNTP